MNAGNSLCSRQTRLAPLPSIFNCRTKHERINGHYCAKQMKIKRKRRPAQAILFFLTTMLVRHPLASPPRQAFRHSHSQDRQPELFIHCYKRVDDGNDNDVHRTECDDAHNKQNNNNNHNRRSGAARLRTLFPVHDTTSHDAHRAQTPKKCRSLASHFHGEDKTHSYLCVFRWFSFWLNSRVRWRLEQTKKYGKIDTRGISLIHLFASSLFSIASVSVRLHRVPRTNPSVQRIEKEPSDASQETIITGDCTTNHKFMRHRRSELLLLFFVTGRTMAENLSSALC